jgi:hypothetical protein
MLAGEQQRGPFAGEVGLQTGRVTIQLRLELRVGGFGEELDGRLEVRGARRQVLPEGDLGAQAVGLAEDLLGDALVVPEAGLLGQFVELGDAGSLRLEVKDAPRSTGSVRPSRGWRTCPPSSGPGDPGAAAVAAR